MKRSAVWLVVALSFPLLVPIRATEAQKSVSSLLETEIRQAWKDWQKKNDKAFASVLATDAVEVEADGRGPRDKKATLADMHAMDVTNYSLSDFKFISLGANSELATYTAKVDGAAGGQKFHMGLAISEVWVKRANEWQLLHYQETEVK